MLSLQRKAIVKRLPFSNLYLFKDFEKLTRLSSRKVLQLGSTAIGLKTKEGVVLAVENLPPEKIKMKLQMKMKAMLKIKGVLKLTKTIRRAKLKRLKKETKE